MPVFAILFIIYIINGRQLFALGSLKFEENEKPGSEVEGRIGQDQRIRKITKKKGDG